MNVFILTAHYRLAYSDSDEITTETLGVYDNEEKAENAANEAHKEARKLNSLYAGYATFIEEQPVK